jgi:hypothetical protein
MPKEMKDIKRKLPEGAVIKCNTDRREATILAPKGHIWQHNKLNTLHYCQPTDTRHQLFEDMISDVSRGTLKT